MLRLSEMLWVQHSQKKPVTSPSGHNRHDNKWDVMRITPNH